MDTFVGNSGHFKATSAERTCCWFYQSTATLGHSAADREALHSVFYHSQWFWWHQTWFQWLSRPCTCVCMAVNSSDDTRHAFSGRAGPWQSWPCTLYCSWYLFHSQWLMIPDPVTCSPVCITASNSNDTRHAFSCWVGPVLVFVWQSVTLMIPGMLSAAEWALCLCLYGSQ